MPFPVSFLYLSLSHVVPAEAHIPRLSEAKRVCCGRPPPSRKIQARYCSIRSWTGRASGAQADVAEVRKANQCRIKRVGLKRLCILFMEMYFR